MNICKLSLIFCILLQSVRLVNAEDADQATDATDDEYAAVEDVTVDPCTNLADKDHKQRNAVLLDSAKSRSRRHVAPRFGSVSMAPPSPRVKRAFEGVETLDDDGSEEAAAADHTDFCEDANDLCLNGGRCVSLEKEAICVCVENFVGPRCEAVDDPNAPDCKSNDCHSDSTCYIPAKGTNNIGMDVFNPKTHAIETRTYMCHCPPGMKGDFCTEDAREFECAQNYCMGRGRGIYDAALKTCDCECGSNFAGEHCELQTACANSPCRHVQSGIFDVTTIDADGNKQIKKMELENGCEPDPKDHSKYTCHCAKFFKGDNCDELNLGSYPLGTDGCDPCWWTKYKDIAKMGSLMHCPTIKDDPLKCACTKCQAFYNKVFKDYSDIMIPSTPKAIKLKKPKSSPSDTKCPGFSYKGYNETSTAILTIFDVASPEIRNSWHYIMAYIQPCDKKGTMRTKPYQWPTSMDDEKPERFGNCYSGTMDTEEYLSDEDEGEDAFVNTFTKVVQKFPV